MKLVFAPRALRDLEAIAVYLSERSPGGARNVIAAIKTGVDALAFFPEIGPVIDRAGHRRLPVLRYPYVVFYASPRTRFLSCTSVTLRASRLIRSLTSRSLHDLFA